MLKKILIALLSCVALGPAFAALTFTLTETGGDVVMVVSGSLNTTALTPISLTTCGTGAVLGIFNASPAIICTNDGTVAFYNGISGPLDIGPSAIPTFGSSASGDAVFLFGGFSGVPAGIGVPVGYTSGTSLSAANTFASATLASLGVTPGTYTWTLGSGATADSIVVNAGATPAAASIPTLGEYALMALAGLLMLATVPALRRRGG